MKTVFKFATYLIITFSSILFTNFALSAGLYIEGQIMQNNVNTVETDAYSGTVSGVTFTNLKGKLDYKSKEATGLELGYKVNDHFRIGLQFTEFQLDFSKGSITGTATDDFFDPVSGDDYILGNGGTDTVWVFSNIENGFGIFAGSQTNYFEI